MRAKPDGGNGDGNNNTSGRQERVYFATCARGLGKLLAEELRSTHVGARVTAVVASGVEFTGDKATAYRACLWLRTAIRVLERMGGGDLSARDYNGNIYDAIQRCGIRWEDVLLGGKLSFKIAVRANRARDNERILMMRAKDGIRDRLRNCGIERFNIYNPRDTYDEDDGKLPDVPLFISLNGDSMVVYRDLVGSSLHKRGYHARGVHNSALNETVAAAMAYYSGITPYGTRTGGSVAGPVVDPMCGSATLLIEYALLRYQIAPGLLRKSFAFENPSLPDFDTALYGAVRREALAKEIAINDGGILGCDRHHGAAQLARDSVWEAGLEKCIEIANKDINDLRIRQAPQLVLCNPPWGMRLEEDGKSWSDLGHWAKNFANNAKVVVISGEPQLTRKMRMKAGRKHPVRIGNVDCRILTYDVLPKKKRKAEEDEILVGRE